MTFPYLDIVRNRVEVLLALMRVGLVVVGYLYLRGDIGIDDSELSMFWLGIGSIAIALLYQAVEVGLHIWSIARRQGHTDDVKVFSFPDIFTDCVRIHVCLYLDVI